MGPSEVVYVGFTVFPSQKKVFGISAPNMDSKVLRKRGATRLVVTSTFSGFMRKPRRQRAFRHMLHRLMVYPHKFQGGAGFQLAAEGYVSV